MADAEGIPPTASTASVGLGLNYASDRVFGYSGIVGVTNVEATLLEFTTGDGLIVGAVQPYYAQGSGGNNYLYKLYLNDIIVVAFAADGAVNPFGYGTTDVRIVVPPFTKFKFTAQNAVASDSNDQAVTITGRVYDA